MKTFLLKLAMLTSLTTAVTAKGIDVGQAAPSPLQGINQEQQQIDLGSTFENGLTLIYFYPKADTPGCTAQSCSLGDSYSSLNEQGLTIFGVSYDSPEKQKAFKEKYHLPFDLIADTNKRVSKAFKRGFFSRQAYLIKDGVIVWRDLSASTKGQADDVKRAIQESEL